MPVNRQSAHQQQGSALNFNIVVFGCKESDHCISRLDLKVSGHTAVKSVKKTTQFLRKKYVSASVNYTTGLNTRIEAAQTVRGKFSVTDVNSCEPQDSASKLLTVQSNPQLSAQLPAANKLQLQNVGMTVSYIPSKLLIALVLSEYRITSTEPFPFVESDSRKSPFYFEISNDIL
ncbi:hypothetical protein CLF_104107 [Clonorchis sinensis]|uniref:Uncharacterized protein n=1 Tax=Clonorchis sinensis TaxID=79923 RepID=G7YB01_CLOSI|nr:hypothetical protein CLF_104107 [Clonorchis sinensis]